MTKVDIISGFLGAGKTTLIKKLLKEAYQGEKLVLIENEFGEISIDGGFLKESGIQITRDDLRLHLLLAGGRLRQGAARTWTSSSTPTASSSSRPAWASSRDVILAVQNTVKDEPEHAARQLRHRGRRVEGEGLYEELRRVL